MASENDRRRGHPDGSSEPVDRSGPDSARNPEPDSGGSVPPGEPSPDADSAGESGSAPEPAQSRPARWMWVGAVIIAALLVALFFVSVAFGLGLS